MPAQRRNTRVSRANESRETGTAHEMRSITLEPVGLLDARNIPPREGMVQRWVRTLMHGEPDPGNVMRKRNQGWQPRLSNTVPKGANAPIMEDPQMGSIIGVHGMILMERSSAVHEDYIDMVREDVDNQMESVRLDAARYTEDRGNKDYRGGFGRPQVMDGEMSVNVGHKPGRAAPVSDD